MTPGRPRVVDSSCVLIVVIIILPFRHGVRGSLREWGSNLVLQRRRTDAFIRGSHNPIGLTLALIVFFLTAVASTSDCDSVSSTDLELSGISWAPSLSMKIRVMLNSEASGHNLVIGGR